MKRLTRPVTVAKAAKQEKLSWNDCVIQWTRPERGSCSVSRRMRRHCSVFLFLQGKRCQGAQEPVTPMTDLDVDAFRWTGQCMHKSIDDFPTERELSQAGRHTDRPAGRQATSVFLPGRPTTCFFFSLLDSQRNRQICRQTDRQCGSLLIFSSLYLTNIVKQKNIQTISFSVSYFSSLLSDRQTNTQSPFHCLYFSFSLFFSRAFRRLVPELPAGLTS